MKDKLFCGAARVDITPSEEEVSGLFGLMGTPYAGIIDRVSARVIALGSGEEKALIVAFDLDKAPEPVTWLPELAAHTGIAEDRILYFSTHTHSAPLTTIRPRERNRADAEHRANMDRYEAVLHDKLFACADEALANMRPARMGVAWGNSFVNVNRNANFVFTDEKGEKYPFICEGMNWGAPVDRRLFTLRIEDLEGNPIAFFMNYAMHCCIMFLNNYDGKGAMGISGDIAGRISTLVEKKYPGSVAVWSSGAAGDVDPVLFNAVMYPDPEDGHYVKEVFPSWETTDMLCRMIVGWHFKDIAETIEKITCDQETAAIRSALEWSETASRTEEPYRIRIQALQLGNVALVGIGGELYNSLASVIQEASPAAHTVVINHNASLINDAGYILDDDAIHRAYLEAPTQHFIPGGKTRSVPGTVAPSLGEHIRHMLG
ncbi:MAG: hypothetical protein ACI4P4_12285 [Faecousia sp.]